MFNLTRRVETVLIAHTLCLLWNRKEKHQCFSHEPLLENGADRAAELEELGKVNDGADVATTQGSIGRRWWSAWGRRTPVTASSNFWYRGCWWRSEFGLCWVNFMRDDLWALESMLTTTPLVSFLLKGDPNNCRCPVVKIHEGVERGKD